MMYLDVWRHEIGRLRSKPPGSDCCLGAPAVRDRDSDWVAAVHCDLEDRTVVCPRPGLPAQRNQAEHQCHDRDDYRRPHGRILACGYRHHDFSFTGPSKRGVPREANDRVLDRRATGPGPLHPDREGDSPSWPLRDNHRAGPGKGRRVRGNGPPRPGSGSLRRTAQRLLVESGRAQDGGDSAGSQERPPRAVGTRSSLSPGAIAGSERPAARSATMRRVTCGAMVRAGVPRSPLLREASETSS